MSTVDENGTLAAVMLEDDPNEFQQLATFYTKVFSLLGYRTSFVHCRAVKELVSQLKLHPHVVICDVHLAEKGSGDDYHGLAAIAEYKKKFPHIVFVANTRKELDTEQFGIRYPNPDVVVAKVQLRGDQEYRRYLTKLLASKLRRNVHVAVEFSDDARVAFTHFSGPKPTADDLKAIVSEVTYTGHELDVATTIRRVVLTPIEGGYSGSAVFELRAHTSETPLGVPGVLKISSASRAHSEYENYSRYVKWYLPYVWRTDVLGVSDIGGFGAVCYSFVLGGTARTNSATHFLRRGDGEIAARVVKTIFDPDKQSWYSLRRSGEGDLMEHYFSRFIKPTRENAAIKNFEKVLLEFCARSNIGCTINKEAIRVGGTSYEHPQFLLFARSWGPYQECLCHGDLNSGNIIASEDRDSDFIAFIDFQQTGFAHVFSDFIVFEASVRINYPRVSEEGDSGSLLAYIGLENLLLEADVRAEEEGNGNALDSYWESLPAHLKEIARIRRSARKNFPERGTAPFFQYVYGVAVEHIRVLSFQNWDETTSLRLLSVILACLKFLEKYKDR